MRYTVTVCEPVHHVYDHTELIPPALTFDQTLNHGGHFDTTLDDCDF